MTMMASPIVSDLILGADDFRRLSCFITTTSGIKMSPGKRAMVESRLRRRVRSLGFEDFATYCEFVFDSGGLEQEGSYIIDAVTTNKTDFFREPDHFRFLTETVLPGLDSPTRAIKVWSAACSIGAEPFTLAMVLAEYAESHPGFDYDIIANDLCLDVLDTAGMGIYPEHMVEPVPLPLRRRYLLRSRNHNEHLVRIAPALRSKVRFFHLNLMEANYPVSGPFQVIFCRNVLIYFDKPTQARVLGRLCGQLATGGHLFIGHSETVAGFDLPLRQVAPTILVKL